MVSLSKKIALAIETVLGLTDTPDTYAGQGGKYFRVNSGEDAMEFATITDPAFLTLTDTPAAYTGEAGKRCRVKDTEDGLEFVSMPDMSLYMLKSVYDTDGDGRVDKIAIDPVVSDNLAASDDAEVTEGGTTMVKKKELTVPSAYNLGTMRIKFDMHRTGDAGEAIGRIKRNGGWYGTEWHSTSETYVTYSEDLDFAGGDTIELWGCKSVYAGAACFRNFRVYCDGVFQDTVW